jgi:hypothetical protein
MRNGMKFLPGSHAELLGVNLRLAVAHGCCGDITSLWCPVVDEHLAVDDADSVYLTDQEKTKLLDLLPPKEHAP